MRDECGLGVGQRLRCEFLARRRRPCVRKTAREIVERSSRHCGAQLRRAVSRRRSSSPPPSHAAIARSCASSRFHLGAEIARRFLSRCRPASRRAHAPTQGDIARSPSGTTASRSVRACAGRCRARRSRMALKPVSLVCVASKAAAAAQRFVAAPARSSTRCARSLHQFARAASSSTLERRRHARFQRKARQKILAEGMDGLDFQAARRFERLRRTAAAPGANPSPSRFSRRSPRCVARASASSSIAHLPSCVEQPPRHLRRRGLGVGEAENAFGLRAVEQKPRHAVGERVGLARAGIGRNPGRTFRIGGDRARRSTRSFLAPIRQSDHSRTRARWS